MDGEARARDAATMPLIRSIPSVSIRSAGMPCASAQSRSTSDRPTAPASLNIAKASEYAAVEYRSFQKPYSTSGLGTVTFSGRRARARA